MRSIGVLALALALAGSAAWAPTASAAGWKKGEETQRPAEPGREGRGQVGRTQAPGQGDEQEAARSTYNLARHMEALARIGEKQGSAETRKFAKRMGDEYKKIADDLVQWSNQNNVSLQGGEPEGYKDNLQRLEGMKGREFDSMFYETVRRENQKVVNDIDRITSGGNVRQGFKDSLVKARQVLDRFGREAEKMGGGRGGATTGGRGAGTQ